MSATINLWIRTHDEGQFRLVLSIPHDIFQKYSLRPLKWLCFLGYTIHGEEGDISKVPDDTGIVDYDAKDVAPGNYYYLSQGDARLIDLQVLDDRTLTASDVPASNSNFRNTVLNRDGSCILTGSTTTEACHIIPHAKGSQYLKNLIAYRRQTIQPVLDDIDDPRNGILLNQLLHTHFGNGEVAFLTLPNFVMDSGDVAAVSPNPTRLAHMHFTGDPLTAPNLLVYQNFTCSDETIEEEFRIHNQVAQHAIGSDTFPPPFLFHIGYGVAAFKAWGVPSFKRFATGQTNAFYYASGSGGSGSGSVGGGNGKSGNGVGGVGAKRKRKDVEPTHRMTLRRRTERQTSKRAPRQKQKTAQEDHELEIDAADVIFGLWMHNAERDIRKAREFEERKNKESVEKWLQSTV